MRALHAAVVSNYLALTAALSVRLLAVCDVTSKRHTNTSPLYEVDLGRVSHLKKYNIGVNTVLNTGLNTRVNT